MIKLNKIVKEIIELVKDNRSLFKRIYKEDKEVCDFEFDIEKLIQILEKYREKRVNDVNLKEILIGHYGNPYITAMLCMEGILNQAKMTIVIEDFCYGLNKAIIKIVNDCLKEYKMEFTLKNNLSNSEIECYNFNEVVCLGNSNTYMRWRKIKNNEVKYVSLFNINLYYDSEEYEEIVDSIRQYAINNLYEIEIFDDTEDFEDVIYMINHNESKYCAVLLSKDKDKQEAFKKEINSKIICINENPFNQFEFEIPKEVWGRGRT